MRLGHFFFISAWIVICASQRSPYAGRRPIGYPVLEITTSAARNDTLGNRFGENGTTTTQRLPVEALGDRDLFNRLGQLPQDKQPFWVLNWQALEQHRQKPQSYPQKPNIFAQSTITTVQAAQNKQSLESTQTVQNNQTFG
ncbi:unnamed protein product [Euphydryas editha]|uniref:Uncharacterized protein n=1 Tax=Euphydryas editha TaxID=104508 RepID=A0AAU9U122_EUPED|nr:unnamed protein product [Euphydryas editha]